MLRMLIKGLSTTTHPPANFYFIEFSLVNRSQPLFDLLPSIDVLVAPLVSRSLAVAWKVFNATYYRTEWAPLMRAHEVRKVWHYLGVVFIVHGNRFSASSSSYVSDMLCIVFGLFLHKPGIVCSYLLYASPILFLCVLLECVKWVVTFLIPEIIDLILTKCHLTMLTLNTN